MQHWLYSHNSASQEVTVKFALKKAHIQYTYIVRQTSPSLNCIAKEPRPLVLHIVQKIVFNFRLTWYLYTPLEDIISCSHIIVVVNQWFITVKKRRPSSMLTTLRKPIRRVRHTCCHKWTGVSRNNQNTSSIKFCYKPWQILLENFSSFHYQVRDLQGFSGHCLKSQTAPCITKNLSGTILLSPTYNSTEQMRMTKRPLTLLTWHRVFLRNVSLYYYCVQYN